MKDLISEKPKDCVLGFLSCGALVIDANLSSASKLEIYEGFVLNFQIVKLHHIKAEIIDPNLLKKTKLYSQIIVNTRTSP